MVRESRRVHFASQWPPSEPTGFYLDGAGGRLLPRPLSRLATPSRPQGGANSTSQGQPRTIFRRALERGNLVRAEVTAREVGRVTIAEALELTALVAKKQPDRYGRFAARWLCLWLEEHEQATLDDVAVLVSKLRSLATPKDAGRRWRS
jgi:hypothetical protein